MFFFLQRDPEGMLSWWQPLTVDSVSQRKDLGNEKVCGGLRKGCGVGMGKFSIILNVECGEMILNMVEL